MPDPDKAQSNVTWVCTVPHYRRLMREPNRDTMNRCGRLTPFYEVELRRESI